ncbi:ribonuclease Z isoform X2 [Augochlora pura]
MLQRIQKHNFLSTHSFINFIRCRTALSEDIFHSYNKIIMEQNNKIKRLGVNNSTTSVQVIGSGANGAPSSIFISSDHNNYIFNCGEGLQRLIQEHHFKLAKVEHIFITKHCWKNIGGLTGILLTLQEMGLSKITFHGSNEIAEFLNKTKIFAAFYKIKFNFAAIDESKPYEDDIMSIYYVPISKIPKDSRNQSLNESEENLDESNINGKRYFNYNKTKLDLPNTAKRLKANTDIYTYICEIHPRQGKLSLEKCLKFGVQVGPLLSKLKRGLDIIKKNGQIVRSKDVCMEPGPKVTLIVVECPDEDYLEPIVNNTKFSKYHLTASDKEHKEDIVYIFHFTPEDIFNHPRYQAWLQKFPSRTEHVILNNENTCMGSEAVYKQQYIMNTLQPEIFPLLSEDSLKEEKETINNNIHRAKTLQQVKIHPFLNPITKTRICPTPEKYIDCLLEEEELRETLDKLKEQISKKTEELNLVNTPEYPRIVMLGTGSSTPNKVRNTSAILLRIDKNSSMLLDCSEGTVCQIIRFYGNSKAKEILRSIKAVFLSHKHADHHLGIIGLMKAREKLTTEKLFIFLPQEISNWLNAYNDSHKVSNAFDILFYDSLNIKQMDTVIVKHCREAFGISITLKDLRKIVYSGDAMPCENLVNLGRNCDLLIHEATMEDKLEKLAALKYHSTVSQAVEVGKTMNAKFTLLTHFSQRYSKIPRLSEEFDNVGIAYDNMDIKLSYLPLLPHLYPCMKLVFSEYYDQVERRTDKKTFEPLASIV